MPAVPMHVTYRPKPGREDELLALVKRHWPALHRNGLSTEEPAVVYRATDKRTGNTSFIEMFSWKDEQSSAAAHRNPDIGALWGPMEGMLDGLELARISRVD